MRRVPQDVERLMWLIAENRDPKAIADFEARFPDLRLELAKHIAMVSGLKNASRAIPRHEVPRFVPRTAAPQPAFNRALLVAAAFVIGAIAFGSYAVMSLRPKPAPNVVQTTPETTTPPIQPNTGGPPKTNEPIPYHPGGAKSTAPALTELDPMSRPVTLKVDRAPLEAAIAMVCKSAGLTCEIAPGFPQQEVGVDYQGQAASVVLSDMGERYGFTAVPQGDGRVLVIPARPGGEAAPNEAPGESGPQAVGKDLSH